MRSDWRFVAMIIDRVLLFGFSVVIMIGTVVVTISAPSLRDQRIPLTVYFPGRSTYEDS